MKKYLILSLLLSSGSQLYASSSEETPLSSLVSSSSAAMYGGSKGVEIFDTQKAKTVQGLSKRFQGLRKNARSWEDIRDTMPRIVDSVVQARHKIAQMSHSENADDFGLLRLKIEDDYLVTPLFEDRYQTLRALMTKQLGDLLPSAGTWIEGPESRHRLRVLKPHEWPLLVREQDLEASVAAHRNPSLTLPSKENCLAVLDVEHFSEFRRRGSVCAANDGLYPSYQAQLEFKSRLALRALAPAATLTGGPDPRLMKLPSLKQVFVAKPDNLRLLHLNVEHKIGEDFVPAYGFMTLLPNSEEPNLDGVPFMLLHTPKPFLPYHTGRYEARLAQAILASQGNEEEAIEAVGRFIYAWNSATPAQRGSAADCDFISEALYDALGYTCTPRPQPSPMGLDHMTYYRWSETDFLTHYRDSIILKKKG